MSRIAYVNGRYLPHRFARVHIEDRGFQFADAVYEVIAIAGGRFVDEARHLERLKRSLGEVGIAPPMSEAALRLVLRETVRRNGVADGIVYLQVTRGAARRDFAFPKAVRPSLVVTARHQKIMDPARTRRGISVIMLPDQRWRRPDIKSVALLPNVMAKQRAAEAGAGEAWQVDTDGNITEGTSSNAWIVTAEGELVTRQADTNILNGVTRRGLVDILAREGVRLVERSFSVAEAKAAREAFITSATNGVMPVVVIDGTPVGAGRPGPVSLKLAAAYRDFMRGQSS
ncbi:MAG: D-amino-acid transaminase [Stellaceae bacterium]